MRVSNCNFFCEKRFHEFFKNISAISNSRRSARQLTHQQQQQQLQQQPQQPLIDPNEHFSPVNQPHWVLKPLFFEVPQRDPNPIFVGRQWLYG